MHASYIGHADTSWATDGDGDVLLACIVFHCAVFVMYGCEECDELSCECDWLASHSIH